MAMRDPVPLTFRGEPLTVDRARRMRWAATGGAPRDCSSEAMSAASGSRPGSTSGRASPVWMASTRATKVESMGVSSPTARFCTR